MIFFYLARMDASVPGLAALTSARVCSSGWRFDYYFIVVEQNGEGIFRQVDPG